MFDRVREISSKLRIITGTLHRAGAFGDLGPSGMIATARTVAKGSTGPSAIFRVHGSAHPDRVAFEFEGQKLSFRDVDTRIDHLASALKQRGFHRGDCAILMFKNRPECFEVSAALSRIGGAPVSVSWRSTASELSYLVNHSGARSIFFEAELWPAIEPARPEMPKIDARSLFPVGGTIDGLMSIDTLREERDRSGAPATEQEGAVIIYTSGTTGRPKGAVRKFSRGQLDGYAAFIGQTPMRVRDRHLCVCPLYHSTGLVFAAMSLTLGGTVILQREFDPERFLDALERENIHTTTIIPTMLHRLMALPESRFARHKLSSLRALFCGGAQLPAPLATRTLERLGPVLYNFYGATETGLVTIAKPEDLQAVPGTIGRALPGCDIRLFADDGTEVANGDVGELFVRNSTLVDGYHADADATKASLREGYFSVGDLAVRDSEGRLQIVGRKRDMVISGGVKIYPVEIEETLHEHPDVAHAAVIGVPDEEWGERLRAFVVPRPGQTLSCPVLRAHCKTKLSGPKVPREWAVVDTLPTNSTGKVLKRELRGYQGPVERV
jgi:long-chain acyl-CoA synthetase